MVDFKPKYQNFVFTDYTVDAKTGKITYNYSFDRHVAFSEVLDLGSPFEKTPAIERAAELYWLLAGVSYYKAYLAPQIECPIALNPEDARFLNDVYTQGLGQFLFENKLDPAAVARFEASQPDTQVLDPSEHRRLTGKSDLVPLGGGKDSLVTVELLRQHQRPFTLFRVNPPKWLEQQIQLIDTPAIIFRRRIDPSLLEHNAHGALNGHVPVTAIVSAASVIAALISGSDHVVFSNEASASIPNTTYRGLTVNHQYSKSLEFEAGFAAYVRRHIASDLGYFSLLAPFSEIKVADLFARLGFDKYRGWWSSSNENYRLDRMDLPQPSWDLRSPKTIAVFATLAPFVAKSSLVAECGGNPLEIDSNNEVVEQLLGLRDFKPFECVADIEEMRWAFGRLQSTGRWPELDRFKFPATKLDPYIVRQHRIPQPYQPVIAEA